MKAPWLYAFNYQAYAGNISIYCSIHVEVRVDVGTFSRNDLSFCITKLVRPIFSELAKRFFNAFHFNAFGGVVAHKPEMILPFS